MMLNRPIVFVLALAGLCRAAAYAQNPVRSGAAGAPATRPAAPLAAADPDELEMAPMTLVGYMPPRDVPVLRNAKAELQRANGQGAPTPIALTRDGEAGATTRPRPTLYFYLPEATDKPIVAVLNRGEDTLKRWTLNGHAAAGIYALTLGKSDPPLVASDDYEWFVEVRAFPNAPSKNPLAQSKLRRVEADRAAPLAADAGAAERVVRLGEAGLYYDAVDELLRSPLSSLHESVLRGAPRDREALLGVLKLKRVARQEPTPVR